TAYHGEIADPLSRAFPETDDPRNARVFGQPTIRLRVGHIVKHIDDAGSANTRRIIDACLLEAIVFAKLLCARLCQVCHVVLRTEMEAAGWAGLDARRFQSLGDTVGAERALEHLLRARVELRDIERAS